MVKMKHVNYCIHCLVEVLSHQFILAFLNLSELVLISGVLFKVFC